MEALVARLCRYVVVDSESGNESAMANLLMDELKSMGFSPELQKPSDGLLTNAGNVVCRIPGNLDGDWLMLTAHMDTVKPGNGVCPHEEDGYLYSNGTTILGGDDKAGVSVIMATLENICENKLDHIPLEIVFSFGEETGLNGARQIDPAKLNSKQALVLDSGGEAGRIISAAPGQYSVEAVFHGKAAHAGNAPSKGISAIMMAAKAVTMMKLLQVDDETTANIGTLCAEGATNIVNPECRLIAEVRSRNMDKLYAQKEHMTACMEKAASEFGGTVEINWEEKYQSFSVPDETGLITDVKKAYKAVGIDAYCMASGGGSDANVYQANGILALNLGNGTEKVHTKEERLHIQSMISLQSALQRLVTKQF